MTTFHGWAATVARAPLQPFSYEPADLGPDAVEIAVSHCGICHSDLHLIDDGWKMSKYPFVPGHEIVGRVTAVGSSVAHLAVGQRVGVGWQRSACLACELCLDRQDNLCAKQTATCVGHHGGFADRLRTDGRYAFPIPDDLDGAAAAPLLCGGATVFAPLRRYGVDATQSVGVIGIGGLGHIALLMLRAFGCEVTAFSSSASKRDEALAMGAHHFVPSTEARELHKLAGRFHLILSTVHARLDWITFLKTLRPNGTLCLLGSPPGVLQIPAAALFQGQKSISASEIGDRATVGEMLRFAAKHRIAPVIERTPLAEVNAAIERVRKNEVRYRMVLDIA
jgi:alcohol/geraniol dehydrogenase (NADP+)